MTLVKGINCYTDIAEADDLIKSVFMSKEDERVFWESLSDEDKASLIYSNTLKYDTDDMFYKGYKQDIDQSMQFPRVDNYGDVIEVPQMIKIGLLIQGIKSTMETADDKTSEYKALRKNGVKSYKIKDASVEFQSTYDDSASACASESLMTSGMYRGIYELYFKPYTQLI